MSSKTPSRTPAKFASKSGPKVRRGGKPVARFRLRITAGDVIAIGPGKISLLEAIAKTGSLNAAAKSIDMSYRRAWLLLDEANRSLRRPAVASTKGGSHGGGSELTDVGRQLIAVYRRIETTATRECAGDIKKLFDLLTR